MYCTCSYMVHLCVRLISVSDARIIAPSSDFILPIQYIVVCIHVDGDTKQCTLQTLPSYVLSMKFTFLIDHCSTLERGRSSIQHM